MQIDRSRQRNKRAPHVFPCATLIDILTVSSELLKLENRIFYFQYNDFSLRIKIASEETHQAFQRANDRIAPITSRN